MRLAMHHIDYGSVFWGSLSGILLGIGATQLNVFAICIGALVGISTIWLNFEKIRNERKRRKDEDD